MEKTKSLLNWLSARLSERSSLLGIIAVITSLGVTISPDLQNVIIQFGVAFGGLIAFLTKDETVAKK